MPLILPVEEQSREFDAKLLLACVAAEQGRPALVGSRREIHIRAADLTRGIYFAKSFRPASLRMFRILRDLGFDIIACDEEGLLPYPDELYFERRVSHQTLAMISDLFAWGPENAALFRRCPGYAGTPVHLTGNPRVDLMREDVRGYFDPEVERLRGRFGEFILLNTNFGTVNHRVSKLAWMNDTEESDGSDLGDFRGALTRHRLALFSHFKRLVPELSRAFPDRSLVVRPHPVENHAPWLEVAANADNVHVVHEGSVLPWLMASSVLLQNNCTTAIEAYLLGRPAITYRPVINERFDNDLTNAVTHHASSAAELCNMIRQVVSGRLGALDRPDQRELVAQHITARNGPLASDRIVEVLDEPRPAPRVRGLGWMNGWTRSQVRRAEKFVLSRVPGDRNDPGYQEQRFPGVSIDDVRERVDRFGRLLRRFDGLSVSAVTDHVFRIDADSRA
jgi:surface carbohydrate biosynthesis protein